MECFHLAAGRRSVQVGVLPATSPYRRWATSDSDQIAGTVGGYMVLGRHAHRIVLAFVRYRTSDRVEVAPVAARTFDEAVNRTPDLYMTGQT